MDKSEETKVQEKTDQEKTKTMLEKVRVNVMNELSKQPEGDNEEMPPEVTERLNQILNDAAAALPPGPSVAAQPETRPDKVMEKVKQQITDALAQMNVPPETADRINGLLDSAATAAASDDSTAPIKPVYPDPKG